MEKAIALSIIYLMFLTGPLAQNHFAVDTVTAAEAELQNSLYFFDYQTVLSLHHFLVVSNLKMKF